MKYSIVMPYFHRPQQLCSTLTSFKHFYKDRNDFEIVIVEDYKNYMSPTYSNALYEILHIFEKDFQIVLEVQKGGVTYNPTSHFNQGVEVAVGEFILLTSPECFHMVNILSGADEEFKTNKNKYLVCGCKSTKNGTTGVMKFKDFKYSFHMWYQHTKHRPADYHFCTLISKENFLKINGFDSRYQDGIAFDDDAFRDRVRNSNLEIVRRNDLWVVHVQHSKAKKEISRNEYMKLWRKNRNIYGSDGNG